MSIHARAVSDVGQRRDQNEDSFFSDVSLGLFVVCDGMGGHAAGEVASKMAVDTVVSIVRSEIDDLRRMNTTGGREGRRAILERLQLAVVQANATIHAHAQANPKARGMGTTLSMMLVIEDAGFVAHVGDSRLYLIRNGQLHQVTTDHTVYQELLRVGRAEVDEHKKNPALGALTRAVGVYPNVQVDTLDIDLLPKDFYVLCSDGLHGYFDDFDLPTFVQHCEPNAVAAELVEYANKRGGMDNITAVTISAIREGETAQTMRVRLTLKTLRAVTLFQHLSYSEQLRMISICEAVEAKDGFSPVKEGEQGDAMWIVVEGTARVHRGDTELAKLSPGAHFGEMALVDNRPRSASVTIVGDALLVRMGRAEFFEALRADPVLAVKLLWNIIQSLSSMVRANNEEQSVVTATHDVVRELDPYGSTLNNLKLNAARTKP
jgi:serine/threonine protein phosphatase PrpC